MNIRPLAVSKRPGILASQHVKRLIVYSLIPDFNEPNEFNKPFYELKRCNAIKLNANRNRENRS